MLLFVLCLLAACQNSDGEQENSDEPNTEMDNDTHENQQAAPFKAKDLVYAWVDKLNIRDAPNTKGKTVVSVNSDDVLEFTGEKSEQNETIVLRGVAYDEPWLKVVTADQKEGWVFGGAVKRKDETKGNNVISDEKFDFPHFGKFDLSGWKKENTDKGGEGDVEITTTTYKKGNQLLEISSSDMFDYGYGRTYKLMDANGKTLKERTLYFIADTDVKELTEVVKNFTTSPTKVYQRSQKFKKHHSQFSSLPMMVNGNWSESSENSVAKKEFQVFTSMKNFPKEVDVNDGCSCSFRTHPKDYQSVIFQSTYEDAPKAKAVIMLDGEFIVLKSAKFKNPDYKRGDYHAFYYNDKYELRIVAFKDGTDDGGGPQYNGTMKLSLKDGTELTHINTFGGCGC